jgi:titin
VIPVETSDAPGARLVCKAVGAPTPTPPPTPNAPSNLTATDFSSSQINLSWTDNSSNETGFSIERCTGNGCSNFAQIATVGVNTTTFPNTGLSRNTWYRYRVRAFNGSGNSGYSNIATAKTNPH